VLPMCSARRQAGILLRLDSDLSLKKTKIGQSELFNPIHWPSVAMPSFVSFPVHIDVPQLPCPIQSHDQPQPRYPLLMAAPLMAITHRRDSLKRESPPILIPGSKSN